MQAALRWAARQLVQPDDQVFLLNVVTTRLVFMKIKTKGHGGAGWEGGGPAPPPPPASPTPPTPRSTKAEAEGGSGSEYMVREDSVKVGLYARVRARACVWGSSHWQHCWQPHQLVPADLF